LVQECKTATFKMQTTYRTLYQPISKRDNDTWKSEEGRAKHLNRHLGQKLAAGLTVKDVDEYRTKRLAETTRRKKAPSPASLDREVELLKRMLNYAVSCGSLPSNPIAAVKLLRKPNVRRSVLDDAAFGKLLTAAEAELKRLHQSGD
jgi:site-specific recombinase XerD